MIFPKRSHVIAVLVIATLLAIVWYMISNNFYKSMPDALYFATHDRKFYDGYPNIFNLYGITEVLPKMVVTIPVAIVIVFLLNRAMPKLFNGEFLSMLHLAPPAPAPAAPLQVPQMEVVPATAPAPLQVPQMEVVPATAPAAPLQVPQMEVVPATAPAEPIKA